MTPAPKRPYVRPRIGRSVLRPLWYASAVAGLFAVALIIPRTSSTLPALEGSWALHSSSGLADLPPGSVRLLVAGGHYALTFESAAGTGRSGLEMGDLREADGDVILAPRQGAYGDGAGGWSTQLPAARRLTVRREGDRLTLTDGAGRVLQGRPAAP